MGGFKYKGKEGGGMFLGKSYANERFTLMGVTLMGDFTVYDFIFQNKCFFFESINASIF